MSETEQPGGAPPEPEPTTTPPVVDPPSSPAPDAPEEGEQPEDQREARSRGDRRFAEMTAKLAAAERREREREAEIAWLRQHVPTPQPGQEDTHQQWQRQQEALRSEAVTQVRTEMFHERGASEYPDWSQRCQELISMGADSNFASLLVGMPDGVKVAAALADDPAQVQRIAGMSTPEARAIALGKFAATLEVDGDVPRGAPRVAIPSRVAPVTRAPAPIRPVNGRANPQFNEYTASADQLVDRYMGQIIARQQGR